MGRGRVALAAGVAGAMAAAGVGVALGAPAGDGVRRVATVAAPTPTPVATRRPAAPVALFIGDSYTAGAGGTGRANSFACQTARAMRWVCANDGVPGTGYLQTAGTLGPRGTYPARAQVRRKGRQPAVVVLTGGRNDFRFGVPERVAAARVTLDRLRATYPQARIVVVGPFWVDDHPKPALSRFDALLGAEAARRRLTFVDPLRGRWLTDAGRAAWIGPDSVHPTRAGYTRLAEKLTAALRAAGVPPGPA